MSVQSLPGTSQEDVLKFKIAPHIVEDLGLNLYTSLPRVLVEFVANAYDADSPSVSISLDKNAIYKARRVVKREYELEQEKAKGIDEDVEALATRTLPSDLNILIEDTGHGMSRDDLNLKFLVAGRRRRLEEPDADARSPDGRPLMGRKGIGKLAGFGVAQLVEVVTRKKGQKEAVKITLDYRELVKNRATDEIVVPEERLADGGGLGDGGTRIVLSRLFYDPLKSRPQTIERGIAEHFIFVDPEEFAIVINGDQIEPASRNYAYGWPSPDLRTDELVDKSLPREGGGEIVFRYRLRFTGEKEALPASERGIRVYAKKRLAAAPSLLAADTNMHGFRMTDYLDGIVEADFIDDEKADYIATDRQALRWESPLLSGMHEFLSDEIKEACKRYQKKRDAEAESVVEKDDFTMAVIDRYDFSKKDRRLAVRIAGLLKSATKRGVSDPIYLEKLPLLVSSISHGNVLAAISSLASKEKPELSEVGVELAKLTKDELDQFITSVKARIKGISALRKIVRDVDFNKKREEKLIQQLFEKSPWMIDPTYTQFLTADEHMDILFKRLAKELEIGKYAPPGSEESDKRPDLVFLMGSSGLNRLVVVELKAANVALEEKHRTQLLYYMETAHEWLDNHDYGRMRIEGHLIGSMAPATSKAHGVVVLKKTIRDESPNSDWKVRDLITVLEHTEAAHDELLKIHRAAQASNV